MTTITQATTETDFDARGPVLCCLCEDTIGPLGPCGTMSTYPFTIAHNSCLLLFAAMSRVILEFLDSRYAADIEAIIAIDPAISHAFYRKVLDRLISDKLIESFSTGEPNKGRFYRRRGAVQA